MLNFIQAIYKKENEMILYFTLFFIAVIGYELFSSNFFVHCLLVNRSTNRLHYANLLNTVINNIEIINFESL